MSTDLYGELCFDCGADNLGQHKPAPISDGGLSSFLAQRQAREDETRRLEVEVQQVEQRRAQHHQREVEQRSALLRDFAKRATALGVPAGELMNRRLRRLPIWGWRRFRVERLRSTAVYWVRQELVEVPSGIRAWHVPGLRVSTDGRAVAQGREMPIEEGDGRAVFDGSWTDKYRPDWDYIEPPEHIQYRVECHDWENPGSILTTVPLGEELADWLHAMEQHRRR